MSVRSWTTNGIILLSNLRHSILWICNRCPLRNGWSLIRKLKDRPRVRGLIIISMPGLGIWRSRWNRGKIDDYLSVDDQFYYKVTFIHNNIGMFIHLLIIWLTIFPLTLQFYSKHYKKCKLFTSNKFDLGNAIIERVPEYGVNFPFPETTKTTK